MPDEIAKTSIYLPREDLKLLKKTAVSEETKVNDLLLNAVRPFLAAIRAGEVPVSVDASQQDMTRATLPVELVAFWNDPEDGIEFNLRNLVANHLNLPEMKRRKGK